MNSEEQDKHYKLLKSKFGLKEYIFMTRAGYRHFFVLGKDLKDAEENFMKIDLLGRKGFDLNELPIRLEYDEEKCKNWSMDKYWDNNENKDFRKKIVIEKEIVTEYERKKESKQKPQDLKLF